MQNIQVLITGNSNKLDQEVRQSKYRKEKEPQKVFDTKCLDISMNTESCKEVYKYDYYGKTGHSPEYTRTTGSRMFEICKKEREKDDRDIRYQRCRTK